MFHEDGMTCRHCMLIHLTNLCEKLVSVITADCKVAHEIDNLCFAHALNFGGVAWHNLAG